MPLAALHCYQEAYSCNYPVGRKQQAPLAGILHKSDSVAPHTHHGNPFSEDEEHNDKPLLIASAGSSYAMEAAHRYGVADG